MERLSVSIDDRLTDHGVFALIVKRSGTGIFYGNQAHGTRCDQPEVEGFIVPTNALTHADAYRKIDKLLCELDHVCVLTNNQITKINAWLDQIECDMKLDPDLLGLSEGESGEGWIHVIHPLWGKAVLASSNCD